MRAAGRIVLVTAQRLLAFGESKRSNSSRESYRRTWSYESSLTRGSTPAVANVLIRSEGKESITCAATDLRTSMVAELGAVQVVTEGGISVGAKHLYDIIKSLPDGEVSLRKTDNNSILFCDECLP